MKAPMKENPFKLTFKRKIVTSLSEHKLLSLFQVLLVEQNVDIYANMVCSFVLRCIDPMFVMQCY